MKYDIYAEFWENGKLNEKFKEWIDSKWRKVKEDKSIEWNKKSDELKKLLERDNEFFRKLVVEFLHLYNNEILYLSLYAKIQKVLQYYVQIEENNLKSYIHSILLKQIKGYKQYRSSINKLDLREISKDAYKEFTKQLKSSSRFGFLQEMEKLFNSCHLDKCVILEISFTLSKPYLSKDDEDFYIIDNPVVKEKVFKIPYIRSTAWKGVLRHVSYKSFIDKLERGEINEKNWKYERSKLIRLFGSEKDNLELYLDLNLCRKLGKEVRELKQEFEDFLKSEYKIKDGRAGRLIFFPTFLNQINLDVIAPHDRKRRAITERGPILFEVVPEGSAGVFKLIYFPFDIIRDKNRMKNEVKEDLEILKDAIPKMMLEYGFSAKKTSGYGVAEDKIEFWINGKHSKGSFNDFRKEMDDVIRGFGDKNE